MNGSGMEAKDSGEDDGDEDSDWLDDDIDIPRDAMGIFLCNAESLRNKLEELRCMQTGHCLYHRNMVGRYHPR